MDAIGKRNNLKTTIRLPFVLLLISITSIFDWSSLRFSIFNNTTLLWGVYALTLFIIFKNKVKDYKVLPIKLFLIWVIASAIHGILMSRGYWDYKLLLRNLMTFLLPISVYVFISPQQVYNVLSYWFKYAIIIFIALTPIMYSDAYANFLQPFIIPALFFSLLNKKWKIITIVALVITIVMGFASRSCIIRLSAAFIIGYLCRTFFIRKHLIKILITTWVLPFIFFSLAAFNVFNIFEIDKEWQLSNKWNLKTEKTATNDVLLEDTRTPLYKEVIYSAIAEDYWLLGHSLARGYKTIMFKRSLDKDIKEVQSERARSEVSVLNIFTYMGVIGVVLYFIIFAYASYLAVCKSKNIYIPILGMFISFRWIFGWIEDFTSFHFTYILLWIMMAMCFSPSFRQMTNNEFVTWIKRLFK